MKHHQFEKSPEPENASKNDPPAPPTDAIASCHRRIVQSVIPDESYLDHFPVKNKSRNANKGDPSTTAIPCYLRRIALSVLPDESCLPYFATPMNKQSRKQIAKAATWMFKAMVILVVYSWMPSLEGGVFTSVDSSRAGFPTGLLDLNPYFSVFGQQPEPDVTAFTSFVQLRSKATGQMDALQQIEAANNNQDERRINRRNINRRGGEQTLDMKFERLLADTKHDDDATNWNLDELKTRYRNSDEFIKTLSGDQKEKFTSQWKQTLDMKFQALITTYKKASQNRQGQKKLDQSVKNIHTFFNLLPNKKEFVSRWASEKEVWKQLFKRLLNIYNGAKFEELETISRNIEEFIEAQGGQQMDEFKSRWEKTLDMKFDLLISKYNEAGDDEELSKTYQKNMKTFLSIPPKDSKQNGLHIFERDLWFDAFERYKSLDYCGGTALGTICNNPLFNNPFGNTNKRSICQWPKGRNPQVVENEMCMPLKLFNDVYRIIKLFPNLSSNSVSMATIILLAFQQRNPEIRNSFNQGIIEFTLFFVEHYGKDISTYYDQLDWYFLEVLKIGARFTDRIDEVASGHLMGGKSFNILNNLQAIDYGETFMVKTANSELVGTSFWSDFGFDELRKIVPGSRSTCALLWLEIAYKNKNYADVISYMHASYYRAAIAENGQSTPPNVSYQALRRKAMELLNVCDRDVVAKYRSEYEVLSLIKKYIETNESTKYFKDFSLWYKSRNPQIKQMSISEGDFNRYLPVAQVDMIVALMAQLGVQTYKYKRWWTKTCTVNTKYYYVLEVVEKGCSLEEFISSLKKDKNVIEEQIKQYLERHSTVSRVTFKLPNREYFKNAQEHIILTIAHRIMKEHKLPEYETTTCLALNIEDGISFRDKSNKGWKCKTEPGPDGKQALLRSLTKYHIMMRTIQSVDLKENFTSDNKKSVQETVQSILSFVKTEPQFSKPLLRRLFENLVKHWNKFGSKEQMTTFISELKAEQQQGLLQDQIDIIIHEWGLWIGAFGAYQKMKGGSSEKTRLNTLCDSDTNEVSVCQWSKLPSNNIRSNSDSQSKKYDLIVQQLPDIIQNHGDEHKLMDVAIVVLLAFFAKNPSVNYTRGMSVIAAYIAFQYAYDLEKTSNLFDFIMAKQLHDDNWSSEDNTVSEKITEIILATSAQDSTGTVLDLSPFSTKLFGIQNHFTSKRSLVLMEMVQQKDHYKDVAIFHHAALKYKEQFLCRAEWSDEYNMVERMRQYIEVSNDASSAKRIGILKRMQEYIDEHKSSKILEIKRIAASMTQYIKDINNSSPKSSESFKAWNKMYSAIYPEEEQVNKELFHPLTKPNYKNLFAVAEFLEKEKNKA